MVRNTKMVKLLDASLIHKLYMPFYKKRIKAENPKKKAKEAKEAESKRE